MKTSLLDRLNNTFPNEIGLAAYYDVIRRDLECLLNSRAILATNDVNHILNFGIPDFTHLRYSAATEQQQLCRSIASSISHHESRLAQVSVQIEHNEDETSRVLTLCISAVLADINVGFKSSLDPIEQKFKVTT